MSECVVRMEMPMGCGSCPIANFGYCSINNKQVGDSLMGYPENRPANCPILCQLPEGHGRLIDEKDIWIPYDVCDGHEAMEFVNKAPTIVPAERSET